MDKEHGELAAALIADYMQYTYPDSVVSGQYCLCVDVFEARFFSPLSVADNLSKIQKACGEIAELWRLS